MQRKLLLTLFFFFISLSLCGCQLFVLPVFLLVVTMDFVSQLLTQAFILPFRLLPLAIKYAPLALLFIERIEAVDTFYVELPSGVGEPIRTEHVFDGDGKEILVAFFPSKAFRSLASEDMSVSLGRRSLILTDWPHKGIPLAELREAWRVIKERPGEVWVVGNAVEEMRKAQETSYI